MFDLQFKKYALLNGSNHKVCHVRWHRLSWFTEHLFGLVTIRSVLFS